MMNVKEFLKQKEAVELNPNKITNNIIWYLLHKFFKPITLKAKHKIEIQILESGGFINFTFRFISCSAMGGPLKVKSPMDPILRAEQIAHDNEPCLVSNYRMS